MIFVTFVQYGNLHEDVSINRIISFVNSINSSDNINVVIVDNLKNVIIDKLYKFETRVSIFRLTGSNDYFEFSGYQEGLDFFKKNFVINSSDIFLFLNDTFYRHRFFDGLTRYMFLKKLNYTIKIDGTFPYFIGFVDKNETSECYLNNFLIDSHISTFFFIVNGSFFSFIPSLINVDNNSNVIDISGNKLSISNANDNYLNKVFNWLFTTNLKSWYRSKEISRLDDSETLFFSKKIFCICNEHILSALAKANNINFVSLYDESNLNIYLIIRFFENKLIFLFRKLGFLNYLK